MEEYLKTSRGLVIPQHKHTPGTPVVHKQTPDFKNPGETVSVYEIGDTTYRVDQIIDDLPDWLVSYVKQDTKKAQALFTQLREATEAFEDMRKKAAREVDSVKRAFRKAQESDEPIGSKDWGLYITLSQIGLRPVHLQATRINLLQMQLDQLMEGWKLDFIRWFGAPIPVQVELLSKKAAKTTIASDTCVFKVAEPPMSQDGTEVREEFLEYDVKFVYPQQWSFLTDSAAHMQEAQRRVYGREAYAKATGGAKTTPSGLIVP